jgi:ADP-ribose pyrophosphatase YjhB (NUDIX family)
MRDWFRLVVAVHLVFSKGGKTLLLKRANTGYCDGNYSLVAGHLNGKETARQAAAREAMEEAGVQIKENDLSFSLVVNRRTRTEERIDFFFTVRKWKGKIRNAEPHKCSELKWVDSGKFPKNMVPYVRKALEMLVKGEHYFEYFERGVE